VGYSLLPQEDKRREISGVYNLGASKGAAKYAVRRGFTQGNLLHAFEGDPDKFSLPHYYHAAIGALPTKYYPFDLKLAHPRWDYESLRRRVWYNSKYRQRPMRPWSGGCGRTTAR
jgi:hypothetical protein